jgi:hypothetical protein
VLAPVKAVLPLCFWCCDGLGRILTSSTTPSGWETIAKRFVCDFDRGRAHALGGQALGVPTTTYDLVWETRRYPPKAILGTAYELATGERLASGDFEGGKSGALKVLGKLGFAVEPRRPVT